MQIATKFWYWTLEIDSDLKSKPTLYISKTNSDPDMDSSFK